MTLSYLRLLAPFEVLFVAPSPERKPCPQAIERRSKSTHSTTPYSTPLPSCICILSPAHICCPSPRCASESLLPRKQLTDTNMPENKARARARVQMSDAMLYAASVAVSKAATAEVNTLANHLLLLVYFLFLRSEPSHSPTPLPLSLSLYPLTIPHSLHCLSFRHPFLNTLVLCVRTLASSNAHK